VFERFFLFPILSLFMNNQSRTETVAAQATPPAGTAPAPTNCKISPVPPIDDDEAKAFEAAAGSSNVVDVKGLKPAAALALDRFERKVASLGGSISLTSAYRPPSYQEHLQLVWDKWAQLRLNHDPGCAVLRAQVQDEFARHQLLVSQRPANNSDHTRGLAFDASVSLPRVPRLTLDRVAISSGVVRPVKFSDPVHFKLLASAPRRRTVR
jgi:D-alanyl-D-alanine dipeptidase